MVSLNRLFIRRRHRPSTPLAPQLPSCLVRRPFGVHPLHGPVAHPRTGPLTLLRGRLLVLVVRIELLLRGLRPQLRPAVAARVADVVVRDAAALAVGGQGLVAVRVARVRVLGDDVPRVQEAGDEAEHAEGDVDDGVGSAEADFDPDC